MVKLNHLGVILNALMLAALIAACGAAVARLIPGWQPIYLAIATFLIALEAGILHHSFHQNHLWVDELARYLVPELVLMAVLMRIAATLSTGATTLREDAQKWFYSPLSIFDGTFILMLVLGALIAWLTHTTMQALVELEPSIYDEPGSSDRPNYQLFQVVAGERTGALRRISTRFVGGGVLLLLALSLEVADFQRFAGTSHSLSTLSIIAALVYVISGFLLYSQARLALLRARWMQEGMDVTSAVAGRWTRASVLLIGGVALLATLLPRNYGLGLLDTIRLLLGYLAYAVALLGYTVMWLVGAVAFLPAWLLSALFPPTTESMQTPPPAPFTPPPPPESAPSEPQFLPALIFWICMALLVIYAASIVLQRRPGLLRAVTSFGPLQALLRWLGLLWGDVRDWVADATMVVRERLQRTPEPETLSQARLRTLSPRELVRYFYRSTLRYAASHGIARRAGQTPYEYSRQFMERFPENSQDVEQLTESFVQAQYSPRAPASDDARRIARPWMRLRRRLGRERPK